jgi:hypothetical protein
MFIVFSIVSLAALNTGVVSNYEMVMVFLPIFTRLSVLGTKYGFATKEYLHRFTHEIIPIDDINRDFLLADWRTQTARIIEEEIQSSVMRNEIDLSSYYIGFMNPLLASVSD